MLFLSEIDSLLCISLFLSVYFVMHFGLWLYLTEGDQRYTRKRNSIRQIEVRQSKLELKMKYGEEEWAKQHKRILWQEPEFCWLHSLSLSRLDVSYFLFLIHATLRKLWKMHVLSGKTNNGVGLTLTVDLKMSSAIRISMFDSTTKQIAYCQRPIQMANTAKSDISSNGFILQSSIPCIQSISKHFSVRSSVSHVQYKHRTKWKKGEIKWKRALTEYL